jgi:hypothetical protein
MLISEMVGQYRSVRESTGLLLTPEELMECAINAARFYAGYGPLRLLPSTAIEPEAATGLTIGELALIRPLFVLYAEREQASMLEASRAANLDFYGRSVSEISADIQAAEDGMSERSFVHRIITI